MKFGLHFLLSCAEHQSPRQIYREAIDQCVHGEALGFESAWPVEHHFNLKVSSLSCPTLLLAAIAQHTERMRLGTAIVQLPLANPLRVAEELATLDVLSGGRVELGIGRGSNPAHYAGFNVPAAESRERLAEGLELIRTAWTQDRFTFEGKYWQARGASVVPRPLQTPHPRIHVAANSPETAAFAGQAGCAALFAAHVNPFPKLKELLAIYRNARREAGHGEARPEDVTLLMPTYVAPTLQQVRDEFEESVLYSAQLSASLLQIVLEKAPEAERIKLLPLLEHLRSVDFEKIRTTMGVAGTPADIRDRFAHIEREFNPGRVIAWFNYGGLVPHARVTQSMALFAKTMW